MVTIKGLEHLLQICPQKLLDICPVCQYGLFVVYPSNLYTPPIDATIVSTQISWILHDGNVCGHVFHKRCLNEHYHKIKGP